MWKKFKLGTACARLTPDFFLCAPFDIMTREQFGGFNITDSLMEKKAPKKHH